MEPTNRNSDNNSPTNSDTEPLDATLTTDRDLSPNHNPQSVSSDSNQNVRSDDDITNLNLRNDPPNGQEPIRRFDDGQPDTVTAEILAWSDDEMNEHGRSVVDIIEGVMDEHRAQEGMQPINR